MSNNQGPQNGQGWPSQGHGPDQPWNQGGAPGGAPMSQPSAPSWGGQPSAGWGPGSASAPQSASAPGDSWPPQGQPSAPQWAGSAASANVPPQYGQSGPAQGQPGYGQNQPGQYGNQGQYGHPGHPNQGYGNQGQAGQAPYGGGGNGMPPGQSFAGGQGGQSPNRRNLIIILVSAVLGLALIVGITVWAMNRKDEGTTGTTPTSPASSSQEQSPSPTPSPSPDAKGPGNGKYSTVLARLKKEGFLCTDENNSGFKSTICSHYDSSPIMLAYVGGTEDDKLGRVALQVQDSTRTSQARPLSDFLIKEFAGEDMSAIKSDISTGSRSNYSSGSGKGYYYRGADNGSVVMALDSWPGEQAKPQYIDISREALGKFTSAQKYTCSKSGPLSTICTRKVGAVTLTLRHQVRDDATQDKLFGLDVISRGADQAATAKVLNAEVAAVNKLLGGQGAALQNAVVNSPSNGLTRYVSGVLIDYFPVGGSGATKQGSQNLRPSCWTDKLSFC